MPAIDTIEKVEMVVVTVCAQRYYIHPCTRKGVGGKGFKWTFLARDAIA